MKISSLSSVGSTQLYLKKLLKEKKVKIPHAIIANNQTDGVGSRDNAWKGMDGNLFLSFAISLEVLPKDLKLESASIYFAYILKETLSDLGSQVWLKWPNDFYVDDLKIGGMITNIQEGAIICGVGINLRSAPKGFGRIDIEIPREHLLDKYFKNIDKKFSWKQVFSKFQLEFQRNQNFFTHNNNLRISLGDATLLEDGSININGNRMYSLR